MPPPTRTYAGASFTAKPKKAKHPSNQSAIDRLQKVRETALAQNSRYGQTVKRAMDSLAACPGPIETRAEALKLKYVGSHIAKIIVTAEEEEKSSASLSRSNSLGSTATRSNDGSTKTKKRSRQTTLVPQDESVSSILSKPQLSAKQIAYDKAVAEAEKLVLRQSGWKAILLLDDREQKGEHVQAKLQMSGIPCEKRHLPIGDMAWIARSGSQEIMLGTIVERKTTLDLVSSLFGTRYQEQRLRLQHCGLKQVLLLVEGDLSAAHNCPADTLKMAMMETRIQLNFQVVQTRHLDDTVKFLKGVHRRILQRSFPAAFGISSESSLPSFRSPDAQPRPRKKKKRSLVDLVMDMPPKPPVGAERSMTYNELVTRIKRDREAGTRTVGAIHMAMLKQIPTFSHKKVQAIGQAYPTPSALMQAFDGLTDQDGKTLVQDLSTNDGAERQCRIGPKSAAELYNVCTQGGDPERKPAALPTEQGEESRQKPTKDTPKRSNVATLDKKLTPDDVALGRQNYKASYSLDSDSDEADSLQAKPKSLNTPSAGTIICLSQEWSCSRCTFRNGKQLDLCEICKSPKLNVAAIPMTVTRSDANVSFPTADYDLTQDSYSASEEDPCWADSRNTKEAANTLNSSVLNTSGYSEGQPMFDWADDTGAVSAFDDSSELLQSSPLRGESSGVTSCNVEEEELEIQCVDLSQDDSEDDNSSPETRVHASNVSQDNSPMFDGNHSPLQREMSLKDPPAATDPPDAVQRRSEVAALGNGVASHGVGKSQRLVTLQSAPWDDESSSSDEDEPLIVRCRKRQEATSKQTATLENKENLEWSDDSSDNRVLGFGKSEQEDSEALYDRNTNSGKAVHDASSSDEQDKGGKSIQVGSAKAASCSRETKGATKATLQHAIEVIEID